MGQLDRKKNRTVLIVLAVVGTLGLFAAAGVCYLLLVTWGQPQPTPDGPPVATVTANELMQEYLDNVAAADSKYRDKVIRVTATVLEIDQVEGNYIVSVHRSENRDGFHRLNLIKAFFPPGDAAEVAKLKVNETGTIIARCEGRTELRGSDGYLIRLRGLSVEAGRD